MRYSVNWEALGAFAEVVGAIGVIGSLLYLAAQVRSSNRAAAVHAKFEATRLLNDFMDLLIARPELNRLMLRARSGLDSLSPDEYFQFSNLSLKATWFFSAGYFQFRQRTLAASDWFETRAVFDFWLQSQGYRDWWDKVGRFMYSGDFLAFAGAEVARVAALQPVAADKVPVVPPDADVPHH